MNRKWDEKIMAADKYIKPYINIGSHSAPETPASSLEEEDAVPSESLCSSAIVVEVSLGAETAGKQSKQRKLNLCSSGSKSPQPSNLR